MVCTYCGSPTKVTNSRLQKANNQIWRRRQCLACDSNFTTHEVIELGSMVVVQTAPNRLEPFSRDKLFTSIHEACKHRKFSIDDATALTQTIIGNLKKHLNNGILQVSDVRQTVIAILTRFDQAAAVVYAAYHPTDTV